MMIRMLELKICIVKIVHFVKEVDFKKNLNATVWHAYLYFSKLKNENCYKRNAIYFIMLVYESEAGVDSME